MIYLIIPRCRQFNVYHKHIDNGTVLYIDSFAIFGKFIAEPLLKEYTLKFEKDLLI